MADDIARIIANYKPSAATLEKLRSVAFVAVVGPIGVGKTTIIDEAIKRDKNKAVHLVVGDTSRAPRPGEQDGVDYYFRTKSAMLERIRAREYVQVPPIVTDDLYATSPESYAQNGVAVMAVWASALPQFRALPFKSMRTIFVLPPDFATWQKRLAARQSAPAAGNAKSSRYLSLLAGTATAANDKSSGQLLPTAGAAYAKTSSSERQPPAIAAMLAKRFAEARTSLAFACQDAQTLFVINGGLDAALTDFLALALGEKLPVYVAANQTYGRKHAAALLRELDAWLAKT